MTWNLATKVRPYFGAVVLTCALLTAGGIVALSFYATDAGDLPQLQFPGVGRGDEAEDVDRVFDVHDLGDRGTDGQGLADDHLEPAESARAWRRQCEQLEFLVE